MRRREANKETVGLEVTAFRVGLFHFAYRGEEFSLVLLVADALLNYLAQFSKEFIRVLGYDVDRLITGPNSSQS